MLKVFTMKLKVNQFPFLIGKVLTFNMELAGNNGKFPFLIGKVLTTAFKPL